MRKVLAAVALIAAILSGCANNINAELPANYEVFVINQGGGFKYKAKVNEAEMLDDHTVHVITTSGGEMTVSGYYIEIVSLDRNQT